MRELKGGVYFPRGLPRKALAEVQLDMVWCQYQNLSAIIKHTWGYVAPVERVLNFQETDQSLWTSPNQEDTPISYPLSHSRGKRRKVVAGTVNSDHSASLPRGFISLYRTVLFVMVHISFLLHVRLTLQSCISDSLLFITGVIGLPLNNENNTMII